MKEITNLLAGTATFNESASEPLKPLLAKLARDGQFPDALFITCADSRIVPSLVMQSGPGDLFIQRNVGNLVPPAESGDTSVMAAVEYALGALGVTTIIICGHSGCGAMQAVSAGKDLSAMPHTQAWLRYADQSRTNHTNGSALVRFADDLPEHDKLSQVNVVTQFENLQTYPMVREKVKNGSLRLVGMWFDIANARMFVFDEPPKQFAPVERAAK